MPKQQNKCRIEHFGNIFGSSGSSILMIKLLGHSDLDVRKKCFFLALSKHLFLLFMKLTD
jgi:hypothetical protein